MKNLNRFLKLKLLLPAIFALFVNPLSSQDLCKDPCPPGPPLWDTIQLCTFHWTGSISYGTNSWTETIDAPYAFVMIGYRIRDCNGVKSVIIDDYVYVENKDYWANNAYPAPYVVNPSIASAIAVSPCPYTTIHAAIVAAVNRLINKLNIPQTYLQAYFKGACYSLVKLKFPKGAFWSQPNDFGGLDTVYVDDKSGVYQRIPCNDACCKVTYGIKNIKLENGETQSTWVALSYDAGEGPSCESQPLPDYSKYKDKFELTIYDPVSKTYKKITGTVIGQEPCTLTCPQYCMTQERTQGSFVTDIAKQEAPLEFSANPTFADNYVRITTNQPIMKVVVYDMSGKIVINTTKLENNNELNISTLKSGGPYFLQVYFTLEDVKTVKILKQ